MLRNSITFDIDVKHFNQFNAINQMRVQFLQECGRPIRFQQTTESVVLSAPQLPRQIFSVDKIFISEKLSFEITEAEIAEIMEKIVVITRDPLIMADLLKELDAELKTLLAENYIVFRNNLLPKYVIASSGYFIPGVFDQQYIPLRKGGLLGKLLLKHEMQNGLNQAGYAEKYIGVIKPEFANPRVTAGNIFTEAKERRLFHHGSNTHRMMIYALGKANLSFGHGRSLSLRQLLEMLVKVSYTDAHDPTFKKLLWNIAFDNVNDSTLLLEGNLKTAPSVKDLYQPKHYCYSFRSPFVMNMSLLCFGDKLGLPTLQKYLLDSHYKDMAKITQRFRVNNPDIIASDEKLFILCARELSVTPPNQMGYLGANTFLNLTTEQLAQKPNYQTIITGIVKRNKGSLIGSFRSWDDFYKQQSSPETSVDKQLAVKRQKIN